MAIKQVTTYRLLTVGKRLFWIGKEVQSILTRPPVSPRLLLHPVTQSRRHANVTPPDGKPVRVTRSCVLGFDSRRIEPLLLLNPASNCDAPGG